MVRRWIVPVLFLVELLVFVPGLADAGKPVKNSDTSSSSITLNQSDPHLGGPASFTVTFPNSVKNPRVAIWCYQSGNLGYMATDTYTTTFTLGGGSSAWLSGGGYAQCRADLYYYSYNGGQEYHGLATMSFDAAG
jgi:hypothetical protein